MYTDRFRPLEPDQRAATRALFGRRFGVNAGVPWIVAVGRLVHKKGFEVLVRALPQVRAGTPEARLLIVGEGPLHDELSSLAARVGCEDMLSLVGAVAHADLPGLTGSADVIAVPSVHGPSGNVDGLPNTLLEGLSSGTPVVASRVAGIPDVVRHEDNGLLVGEGDAEELGRALGRLLSGRSLAARLGERARRDAVANLGWTGLRRRSNGSTSRPCVRTMRIDLVFPRFKVLSGAERLILELATALAAAGHQPRIVCHRFDDSCRPLVADGVVVVESGARLDFFANRYLNAAIDYARVLGLSRHLDRGAEARVFFGPALWLLAPDRLVGRAQLAGVYHCFEPPRALYQDRAAVLRRAGAARPALALALWVYRVIDRRLVRLAGAITASGPYAAARIAQVYRRDAVAITHGIDRERLDHPRSNATWPTFDLVTVNYLHPRKRVDLTIRALVLLPGRTLKVVGAGPERQALGALAEALGVAERVTFAGFVADRELAGHYRAARCYVHAAREESFGLSVIEAAYCSLPVVAVAEGGVVDNVRDGVTRRLTDATPTALAAAIEAVLTRVDRAEMGARGRELIDARYRWEQGAGDLLRAIAGAV